MDDDSLKLLPIWQGGRFERGRTYFDLDNPERGPFDATGDEAWPSDHTYVCRTDVPEEVWAQLVTWRRPISPMQADMIEMTVDDLGTPQETIAPGEVGPRPSR